MSKKYTQLTEAERYPVYTMKKHGYSNTVMVRRLGRSRTTVWRTVPRNRGQRGYRCQPALQLARARHQAKRQRVKLTPALQATIHAGLAQHWRPEQIAGRHFLETGQLIGAETLYPFIARDKRAGGTRYQPLRDQDKPYRKQYGRTDYHGRMPGRDIDPRPAAANERSRLGDWEADLIMGQAHRGALVTLVARRCQRYLARPIVRTTATLTTQAIAWPAG